MPNVNRRTGARVRIEHDALGALPVPAAALYGIQTERARRNFPISGRRLPDRFNRAYARIKAAAAEANARLGLLDRRRSAAIRRAAAAIAAGEHLDQFPVDVYQAGAGTSTNMNLNEVIANLATEALGGKRGAYDPVHPNDHVNMSQSTNDTFPTAMRLALLDAWPGLDGALRACAAAFEIQARRHRTVVKSARTHLQDAVPITLGQECGGYAAIVRRAADRIEDAARPLHRLNLGATAAGTGLNAPPGFARTVARILSRDTGLRLRPAENLVEAAMSTADFAAFSGALREAALDLGRVANDLRLLVSGPRTGLDEIALPAVQPGSSIMPGKVNPALCEMLNMVCFRVLGNDATVAAASAAAQLELNVMMPVMAEGLLDAAAILTTSVEAFRLRCVEGMAAHVARCREHFEKSPALATALSPVLGYEKTAELVQEAVRRGLTIPAILRERALLPEDVIRRVFDPRRLTRPGVAGAATGARRLSGRRRASRSGRARRD